MITVNTALVVGASGGLGQAITKELLGKQTTNKVYATYRRSGEAGELWQIDDRRLVRVKVDITRESDLQVLAETIRCENDPPEMVISASGILHERDIQPEKALSQCRQDSLLHLFNVNSIGPLLLAKSMIPLMPKTARSHFAVLSAMVGSIADNRLGGWYGYRASKAALNQFMRTLAVECRRNHPRLCVTAIHPGTTDTGLSQPFQANVKPGKLYSPEQSARRILSVIGNGTPETSGRFVNWDGSEIPF